MPPSQPRSVAVQQAVQMNHSVTQAREAHQVAIITKPLLHPDEYESASENWASDPDLPPGNKETRFAVYEWVVVPGIIDLSSSS